MSSSTENLGRKTLKEMTASYLFGMCVFTALWGLAETIVAFLQSHIRGSFPLSSILILVEGILYLRALKEETMEQAEKQLGTAQTVALVIAAYAVYSLVSRVVFILKYGSIAGFWPWIIRGMSEIFSSLGIYFTSKALKNKDIQKFNTMGVMFGLAGTLFVVGFSVVMIVLSGNTSALLAVILMPVCVLYIIPKLVGNRIVKGAVIGGLIAGELGAVVGAAAAGSKEKNK